MAFEPTTDDFVRGYWYYRPDEGFPPAPVFQLDPSFQGRALSLAGVPGSPALSDYQAKKIIRGWADILPALHNVEMLWVAPKVNQSLFDAISSMPNLRGLDLKHSSIKTIRSDALQGLRFLHLGSSPGLLSIEPLSQIRSLEWLDTENLKRITDFSPLSNLTSLVGLGIDGSMWTTQRVDSLLPLVSLTRLRYVSLINTRVADKSLRPLHQLKELQTLRMANWWPATEVDALRQALPHLDLP